VLDTRNLDKHGKEKVNKPKWKPPPKSKAGELLTRAVVTEHERQLLDLQEKYEKVKDILYLNNYKDADPEEKHCHFNRRDMWLLNEYACAQKACDATTTCKLTKA